VVQKHRRFFLLHIKPQRVARSTLAYRHTFGLGGSALVLFTLLVGSGVLLMLAYRATPEGAYQSVATLQQRFLFGGLVRNVHHFSANLLVAVTLLHLLRVLFTGGYRDGPRRLNWIIGLGLLLTVLAANFTGYLLPWDQLSYWAVTVCTGMLGYIPLVGELLRDALRGGRQVGEDTLVVFHALHTSLLPFTMLVLLGFHFWRVRKAGGVVAPPSDSDMPEEKIPASPHLLLRELSAGLALTAAVLMLAVFVDAPLGEPANYGMSPNPSKAPWYFVGFQELQLHLHPLFAVVVIPVTALVALALIPYTGRESDPVGRWFLTRAGWQSCAAAAALALVVAPLCVVADEARLQSAVGAASLLWRGLIPLAVLVVVAFLIRFVLVRRMAASRAEVVQALFAFFFTAFLVWTATGVWFRGPGMALVGPWGGG
jgi:quinol-cytochrome oxidoreductase complex cytochrome b subunit